MVTSAQFKTKTDDIYSITTKEGTAGQCLVESSNSTLTGLALMTIGTAVYIGSFNQKDTDTKKVYQIFGGATTFIGAVLQIKGVILIGKAGKLMEKERKLNELTYNISPTGIGLKLTF